MDDDSLTSGEFAEMCERASVRLRVAGKGGQRKSASAWKQDFHKELAGELTRRAAASGRAAGSRPRFREHRSEEVAAGESRGAR